MYVCVNSVHASMQLLLMYNFIPVDGDVVTSSVNDVDDEGVAVFHLQGRPRVHPVDRDRVVGFAQPLHWS